MVQNEPELLLCATSEGIVRSSRQILDKLNLPETALGPFSSAYQRASYRAVVNWLEQYQSAIQSSNIIKVRGLVEAFEHLCAVEDWVRASELIFTDIEAPDALKLYWHLSIWGNYEEQIAVCKRIVDHLSPGIYLIDCLFALGDAYRCRGEIDMAISFHEKALATSRHVQSTRGESGALQHLGIAYSILGDPARAIVYFSQGLDIAVKEGDQDREASALGNLTIAHKNLGEYEKALTYGLRSLSIDRARNDLEGIGDSLGNIGNIYHRLGHYDEAVRHHLEALMISRQISNRQAEGWDLANLAAAQFEIGLRAEALQNAETALQIFEEIRIAEGIEKVRELLGRPLDP